jgi:hypothetical protein
MTQEEKRALRLAQRDYEPGDPAPATDNYGLRRRPSASAIATSRVRRMAY